MTIFRSAHQLLLILILLCATHTASAGTLEDGIQWLSDRQDGQGVHRSSDIATRAQTNAQAFITLELIQPELISEQLRQRVLVENERSIESIALQSLIRLRAGETAGQLIDELTAAQNLNGGFASYPGFASDPLSTALAMRVLDRAGQGDGTSAAAAISYLINAQQADGGWPVSAGTPSSVYASAQIALTLVAYANRFELTSPISGARNFILSRRQGDQSFGSVFETALVAITLFEIESTREEIEPLVAWLTDRQQSNGSFNDDAYETALALRVLYLFNLPVTNPERSGLTATIVAAATRLPITGAELTLTGAQTASLVSNDQGIVFNTQLLPGSYVATVSFEGMQPLSFEFALQPGQLSDLGELRLTQPGDDSSTLGIVRGRVFDRSTGDGLGGALIELMPDALTTTSDAEGRFQILQVEAGDIELEISAPGYSRQVANATLLAESILEFSVELTELSNPLLDTRVEGQILSGQTDQPLTDVTIEVFETAAGNLLSSVQTDGEGLHSQEFAVDGLLDIVASGAGLDSVSVSTVLTSGQVFEFSPRMYPTGETPPDVNASRIIGVIVNQANRQPIENALIIVTDPNGQQSLRSASDGSFAIDRLAGPTTTIEVSADAFDPARLLVPILPLETRDLGEVSLKPTALEFYFPDLVMTGSSLTSTDPDSYQLEDQLTVEVSNQGTSNLTQDFELLAFIDANGDQLFDPDTEPQIGSVRVTDDLPIGSTTEVSIAVNAQLTYRDAPFALVVDYVNEVPEQDEINNVASTLLGCRATPSFIGDDGIFEAWRWDGLASNPLINSVSQVPVVGQLTDDNGDGRIDQFDVPDIVFIAGRRSDNSPSQTALVAISGDDGREHWSRTDIRLSQFSSPALGDIDNDGIAEIIAVRGYREEIIAFEHDGALKWRTGIDTPNVPTVLFPPPPHVYDMPIIVNLEGDNEAEVILGRLAYRGLTGEQLWEGEFDGGGTDGGVPVLVAFSQSAVAADIDLDGITDVIAGRTLYDFDGNTVWHRGDIQPDGFSDFSGTPQSRSGYVGIGNFDLDDFAEVVLVSGDEVYLLEHTGETIWGPVNSPDFTRMGAPSIVDLDADGLPEIIVSSNFRVTVFETDGTVKWTADVVDNSGLTSATVFDFENDGLFEVMHIDENDFRIFDGRTGAQLFETRHTSPTVFEYPIVADVDADKQAEIILTGFDRDLVAGVTPGIRVFKARDGAWADAGSVWGSHAFHINDVNEDSTIPLIETPSWLTHNTYRVQRSPLPDPLGRPDFTLGNLQLIDQGPGNLPIVQLRVGNAGPVDAHEPPRLGIFRGDPASGGELLQETRLDTLRAARFQTVNLGEISLDGSGELFAVIDYPNLAEECREGNNARSIPFQATNARGALQLISDRADYAPDAPVIFTVSAANLGGLTASYQVELELRDAQNQIAATFDSVNVSDVPAGISVNIDVDWIASGLLGGAYTLNGQLTDLSGQVLDFASTSFTITGENSGPAAALNLQAQKVEYLPDEIVEIGALVRNISDDTVIELPQLSYTVRDADDATVFSDSVLLSDLLPGTSLETQFVADNTNLPGVYGVEATLRSALTGQILATADLEFTRIMIAGAGLEGRVVASEPSLIQGQTQTCIFTINNLGSTDILDATVRQRVVDVDGLSLFDAQETVDLLSSSDYARIRALDTFTYFPGDYLCLLEIADGATWVGLDADPFSVLGLPTAGIQIDPTGPLETSEAGQSASFSVVLLSPPTASVSIPLEVSDPDEWSLSANAVTFTPATWSIPRTVVVTGLDDDILDGDQNGQIRVLPAQSGDVSYDALDADDIEAINLDDDGAAILVTPTELVTSEDGTSASALVSLNAAPAASVTISLTNPDNSEWLVEPLQLVFDDQNWQTPQTIQVTGVDDAEFDDAQTATLVLAPAQSADLEFDGIDPDDVELRNDDNEVVSILVEPTQVSTAENGPPAQFVVRLAAEPTAEVSVPVGFVDASEWQIPVLEITLDASNWQSGQVVPVSPVDDLIVDGTQTAMLELGAAESLDVRYDGLEPDDVELINTDDDGAQILVTPSSGLVVDEGGRTATFEVVLTQLPQELVVVPLASLDISEFVVDQAALEFTSADGTTPQTVTVTGVDDAEADGSIVGLIEVGRSISTDAAFDGIDPPDVSVTNIDDEQVEITVSPEGVIQTDESGSSAVISVSLNFAPNDDVVIGLTSSDELEWGLSSEQVLFSPTDWTEPREVTVTGLDDDLVDGTAVGQITLAPAISADLRYNGLDPRDVTVINRDNDGDADAAVVVQPLDLITSEDGDTGELVVSLNRDPSAPVTLSLISLNTDEVTLTPAELVFNSGSSPQSVTLIGVDDADLDGDQSVEVIVSVVASDDPDFAVLPDQSLTVTNLDNEALPPAAIIVEAVDLTTSESGDRGSLVVSLNRAPTSPVTVGITSLDPGEVSVIPVEIELSDTLGQSIELIGVDDALLDGDQPVEIVISVIASADPDFAGLPSQSVIAVNADDEVPVAAAILVEALDLETSEAGDLGTLQVSLSRNPSAPVTLSLSSSDEDEIQLSPTQLQLSDTLAATVQLVGVDDDLFDGDQQVEIVIAVQASADPEFAALATQTLDATNLDDEITSALPVPVPFVNPWALLLLMFGLALMARGGLQSRSDRHHPFSAAPHSRDD